MKIGIIFDLDGTLWNAAENIAHSWNIVLKDKENIDIQITPEILMGQMGKVMEDIADNLFPEVDVPLRYEILQECCSYEKQYLAVHGGTLYDGVEDVFEKLSKKYSLFVVSNCQQGYIETFLRYFNFEKYITDTENAGNTKLPKSENIKLVARRNQLDKVFYIGDTQGDMEATDKAGAEFIHAAYGFGKLDRERDSIQSIRELPLFIEKQLKR